MTTAIEIRQTIADSTRKVTEYLYTIITPGTPIEYKTMTLAGAIDGLTQPSADDRCAELQELGILTRTINFGKYNPDGTYKIGRFAMWDLHMDKATALAKVDEWGKRLVAGEVFSLGTERSKNGQTRGGRQRLPRGKDMTNHRNQPAQTTGGPIERISGTATKHVTLATDETEDTKAIAGPDKPRSFEALRPARKADDATALIEAARQYANRGDKMQEHIAALKATAKDLGIEIDEAVLSAGIKLAVDDRLETIALVLPVIDALEAKVNRQTILLADMRDKAKTADGLTNDNRRLRARLETLVAERVVSAQRN
jgi:hypothetical protein